MWALSILPDEMLEDGFAGPTLGLEFAGRVTRVGAAVERFEARRRSGRPRAAALRHPCRG